MAIAALIKVFHEHAGSDKKMNKAELRKLLDQGLVIYQTLILWIKKLFFHINCFLEFAGMLENITDRNASDEIFKGLDQDESGFVDFQEFVTMVAALASLCYNKYQ